MSLEKINQVQDGLPLPHRYWAILAIGLGILVSVLDGVIANVALPTIADDLHTSPANSIWVINAYQLAITVSLLSLSSFGDIWGVSPCIYRRFIAVYLYIIGVCHGGFTSYVDYSPYITRFGAAAITSVNTALIRIIYLHVFWVGEWDLMRWWFPFLPLRDLLSRQLFYPWRIGLGCLP